MMEYVRDISVIELILFWFAVVFPYPGSTTYTIPSIVKLVSAIFVDTMTFLPGGPPGFLDAGAGSNILCCAFGGNVEYNGTHIMGPCSCPNKSACSVNLRTASSISCSPVRKTKI